MASKPADGVVGREITAALRQRVREELPEIGQIANAALQAKAVEAWAYALANSSFSSIRDIPPAGNPDTNEAKRGDQTDHLRGVTRLAIGIAREMSAAYPELGIDMDTVIAGGLLATSARRSNSIRRAASIGGLNRRRRGDPPSAIRLMALTSA